MTSRAGYLLLLLPPLLVSCGSFGASGGHEAHVEQAEDAIAHWTCPMHPSVKEAQQTPCPICRMNLTPVTVGELEGGAVVVDAIRRQRFGIRTSKVEARALTKQIRVPATVRWDDDEIEDVLVRDEGWVEKVYGVESGSIVRKDQPLVQMYSPLTYNAQRDYINARNSTRAVQRIERLMLLGLSDRQIKEIERTGVPTWTIDFPAPRAGVVVDFHAVEGTHLPPGGNIARIASLERVWVEAEVYEDEIGLVEVGMTMGVQPPGAGVPLSGPVTVIEPWVDPTTRRAVVRAELENPDSKLLPNMFVDATLEVPLGEHLAVPNEAVIVTGERRIVFVDEGADVLVPHDVVVGDRAGDWVQIRSGLKAGQTVVSSGVFLVAAESRLRAAETYWGADHGAH